MLYKKTKTLILWRKKYEKVENDFEAFYLYSYSFLNQILSKYEKLNHTSFSLNKSLKNQLNNFKILIYPILDSYEKYSILQIKNWIQSIDYKQLKEAFYLINHFKNTPAFLQYFVLENNIKTEEIEFSIYRKILDQFWNETKASFLHFDPIFPEYFIEIEKLSTQKMEANWLFIIENKYEKLKKHYNQSRIEALVSKFNNLKSQTDLDLLTHQKNALKPIVICNINKNQILESFKSSFDWVMDFDLKTILSKKSNFQNPIKKIQQQINGIDLYEVKNGLSTIELAIKSELESNNILLEPFHKDSIVFYRTPNPKKWITVLNLNKKHHSEIKNCIQNGKEVLVISPIYWYYNKDVYRQIVFDWISK